MSHSINSKRAIIFVDFDGTAAQEIASNLVLQRFAEGDWRELDRQLDAGKISFKDCVLQQFSMLAGTREEMVEFCQRELQLRPGFKEFVQYCRDEGHKVVIVSEALDFMIAAILERERLGDLPVYCDRAVFHSRRLTVELPHFREDCACQVGNCKRVHVRTLREGFDLVVYIGDGSNDLCPAKEADLVFARRRLAEHCIARNIKYSPFEDFYSVCQTLAKIHS
jgi:2-hydroxy-3-keto-5-methylthiopentenyl-1-phosphate phosphatase